MKLLILKTNSFLSKEAVESILNSIEMGILNGFLLLDGNFTYEMVELEQIRVEAPQNYPPEDLKRADD